MHDERIKGLLLSISCVAQHMGRIASSTLMFACHIAGVLPFQDKRVPEDRIACVCTIRGSVILLHFAGLSCSANQVDSILHVRFHCRRPDFEDAPLKGHVLHDRQVLDRFSVALSRCSPQGVLLAYGS